MRVCSLIVGTLSILAPSAELPHHDGSPPNAASSPYSAKAKAERVADARAEIEALPRWT